MRSLENTFKTLLLVGFLVFSGCNDEKTVLYESDLCTEEDCSGHGSCAVIGGDTAVCICDPGYYAAGGGLECLAATPGDECKDVECSGHGTCVVVSSDPDYPVCLCDEGYKLVGTTTCVPAGTGVECGPGTIREGNVCVPLDEYDPDDPGPCMLEIDNVVAINSIHYASNTLRPGLVWAEDGFLAIYTTGSSLAQKGSLYARKIYPSGEMGTAIEVDAAEDIEGYAYTTTIFAAVSAGRVMVAATGHEYGDMRIFVLDLAGLVLHGPLHYDRAVKDVKAVGADFALVLGDGWNLIDADGTISDVVLPMGADDVIEDMHWSVDHGAAVLYRTTGSGVYLQHFDIDGTPLDEQQSVNQYAVSPKALFDTGEHYVILSGFRTDNMSGTGTAVFRMDHDLLFPGVLGSVISSSGTAMSQMVWTGQFFYNSQGRVLLDRYGRIWNDSFGLPQSAPQELGNFPMQKGIAAMDETTIGILRIDEDQRLTWNLATCAAQ